MIACPLLLRAAGVSLALILGCAGFGAPALGEDKWIEGDVGRVKKDAPITVDDEKYRFGIENMVVVIRPRGAASLEVEIIGDKGTGKRGVMNARDVTFEPPLKVDSSIRSGDLETIAFPVSYRVNALTTKIEVRLPAFLRAIAWVTDRTKENKQLDLYTKEYRSLVRQIHDRKLDAKFESRAAALLEFRKQRVGLGLPKVNPRLNAYLCTRIATLLQSAGKPIAKDLETLDKLFPSAEKKWDDDDGPAPMLAIAAEGLSRLGRIKPKQFTKVLEAKVKNLPGASDWTEDHVAWVCARLMQWRGELEAAYLAKPGKVCLDQTVKQVLTQLDGLFERDLYKQEGLLLFVLAEIDVLLKEMLQETIVVTLKPEVVPNRFKKKPDDRTIKVKWEDLVKEVVLGKLSYGHKELSLTWMP